MVVCNISDFLISNMNNSGLKISNADHRIKFWHFDITLGCISENIKMDCVNIKFLVVMNSKRRVQKIVTTDIKYKKHGFYKLLISRSL